MQINRLLLQEKRCNDMDYKLENRVIWTGAH